MQLENITPIPLPQNRLFQDLTGQTFGRLTVRFYTGKEKAGHSRWACECECGTITTVKSTSLKGGATRSCGCLIIETLRNSVTTHGHTANRTRTAEFRTWQDMIARCENPNHKAYKDYGGRGIRVSQEWLRFENFLTDMGSRPTPKHTLDRINNNEGYAKENCRWASRREQGRNRRTTRFLTALNETLSMKEWSERLGINYNTFQQRIRKGQTVEQIALHFTGVI